MADKCSAYVVEFDRNVCYGTKEKETCTCDGDVRRCNFYPELRKQPESQSQNDLISRSALINAYDRAHKGPPGGARKLIEDAPAIDAIPIDQLSQLLAYLFHGCPGHAYPSYQHACHPLCSIDLMEKHCGLYSISTPADQWRAFLSEWMTHGMKIPCEIKMIVEDPMG